MEKENTQLGGYVRANEAGKQKRAAHEHSKQLGRVVKRTDQPIVHWVQ